VQLDRPQMAIWRVRIACWITKATDTHSEYVILIAFPLQQWLHDGSLMLHLCMHFPSCLSFCLFDFYGQECYPGTSRNSQISVFALQTYLVLQKLKYFVFFYNMKVAKWGGAGGLNSC
jgi:hypothetical protein